MKISLTPLESETYFHNALCNGLNYVCNGYGLNIDFEKSEYLASKSKLTSPCYEDVLLQILKDGGKLTLLDLEGDGDQTSSITISEVHERVQNVDPRHLLDMIEENDDAETADVIIQTVFFNEVIFG